MKHSMRGAANYQWSSWTKSTLRGMDGRARLLDAFEGRRQLIVYHFMFGPDDNEGHNSCSLMVDNISHAEHLHAFDTTIALVSAPH